METLYKLLGGKREHPLQRRHSETNLISPRNQPSHHADPVADVKSIEYFKTQDLSRNRFSYDTLSMIDWWPDEILTFLEIIRIAYIDFLNAYTSQPDRFDLALHHSTFFMTSPNPQYEKTDDIKQFLRCKDQTIAKNYINVVIGEDNCYMHELGEHLRSENENKHYLFVRALESLLDGKRVVVDGEFHLKEETSNLIRSYICFYHMKNFYATLDDALRNMIHMCLHNMDNGISLAEIANGLITEIETRVIVHLRRTRDELMFDKMCILNDLLLYMSYCTSLFHFVFNYSRRSSTDLNTRLTPFDDDNRRFTPEVVIRIKHVYRYFLSVRHDREQKEQLIERASIEEVLSMITKGDNERDTYRTITSGRDIGNKSIFRPKYIMKSQKTLDLPTKNRDNTFLIEIDLPESVPMVRKRGNTDHTRKISLGNINHRFTSSQKGGEGAGRQDTPISTSTSDSNLPEISK